MRSITRMLAESTLYTRFGCDALSEFIMVGGNEKAEITTGAIAKAHFLHYRIHLSCTVSTNSGSYVIRIGARIRIHFSRPFSLLIGLDRLISSRNGIDSLTLVSVGTN